MHSSLAAFNAFIGFVLRRGKRSSCENRVPPRSTKLITLTRFGPRLAQPGKPYSHPVGTPKVPDISPLSRLDSLLRTWMYRALHPRLRGGETN